MKISLKNSYLYSCLILGVIGAQLVRIFLTENCFHIQRQIHAFWEFILELLFRLFIFKQN